MNERNIIEPGSGCGTGSDGEPCSPAYLCPACIAQLLAQPTTVERVRESVRLMGEAL